MKKMVDVYWLSICLHLQTKLRVKASKRKTLIERKQTKTQPEITKNYKKPRSSNTTLS